MNDEDMVKANEVLGKLKEALNILEQNDRKDLADNLRLLMNDNIKLSNHIEELTNGKTSN